MEVRNNIVVVLILISFVIGGALGYVLGTFSKSNENIANLNNTLNNSFEKNKIPINEVENRVIDFVNYKLVKPGIEAKVKEVKEDDQFYRFNLTLQKDGSKVAEVSVYTTKDGKYLILNLIKLPEEIEKNVSETPTPKPQVKIDTKNEPTKGDKNADIVIIEFSGYDCPYCARFAMQTLPKILENFDVKFVFKDFPVHGEVGLKAHEAANCALEQGKYWEYHDMLFKRQAEWKRNQSKFIDYAEMLGMNVSAFKACLDSEKYRDEVLKDKEEGIKLGVRGTPTFFINGKKVTGALPYEEFERILKSIQSQETQE